MHFAVPYLQLNHRDRARVEAPRRSGRAGLTQRLAGVLVALVLTVGLLGGCGTSTSTTSSPPATAGNSTTAVGSCPTSNTTSFAKTKFVLHAGLAFGAFHRYLYKPFKAGSFSKGASHRISTFLKAGAAVVVIEHEIRLAAGDVRANPTLCKLIASPLRSLASDVSGAVSQLRGGNTAGVLGAESSLGSITSQSKSNGSTIVDQATSSLG